MNVHYTVALGIANHIIVNFGCNNQIFKHNKLNFRYNKPVVYFTLLTKLWIQQIFKYNIKPLPQLVCYIRCLGLLKFHTI